MVTLKTLFEKSVIFSQMEVERAAHKSLYDINILVAEEGVTALKLSVCMQQAHTVRKRNM